MTDTKKAIALALAKYRERQRQVRGRNPASALMASFKKKLTEASNGEENQKLIFSFSAQGKLQYLVLSGVGFFGDGQRNETQRIVSCLYQLHFSHS